MKKSILSIFAIATLLASCSDDSAISDVDSSSATGIYDTAGKQVAGSLVDSDLTLDGAYSLTGSVSVSGGATLTIEAGTKITASSSGTSVYIAVQQGAKIDVNGTATEPVLMSSIAGEPGDWGGIVLCGEGITSEGVDASAEVGSFAYGGTDSADSSGEIEYLVLRGTGASIGTDSEYNGISFYAVGSGTKVENIAVINGADDGVEFFGGSVNVTNVYLSNNEDDSIDWTEGWVGTVENAYISHTIAGFSTALEADGTSDKPTFTNLTVISTVDGTALQFKKTSGANIDNLYLDGYATDLDLKAEGALSDVQIDGADSEAAAVLDADNLKYTLTSDSKDGTQVDISTWTYKDVTL